MGKAIFPRTVAVRLALAMSCAAVLGVSVARPGETTVREMCRQTAASDPSGGQLFDLIGSAIQVIMWVDCITSGPAHPGLTLYMRMLACA